MLFARPISLSLLVLSIGSFGSFEAFGFSTEPSVLPTPGSAAYDSQVRIAEPLPNQIIGVGAILKYELADKKGLLGLQLLVDGKAYGAEVTQEPFKVVLRQSTLNLSEGAHTLALRARYAKKMVSSRTQKFI